MLCVDPAAAIADSLSGSLSRDFHPCKCARPALRYWNGAGDIRTNPEPVLRAIFQRNNPVLMSGYTSALRQVFISSYIVNAQSCAYIPLWICSALSLLVLRVLADNHDSSFSIDNLALLAHRFHRRTNLHNPASFLDVCLFQNDSVKGHKNPMPESAEIIYHPIYFCKMFLSWEKRITKENRPADQDGSLCCGRWDLNSHGTNTTRSLVLLVCQFRHFRERMLSYQSTGCLSTSFFTFSRHNVLNISDIFCVFWYFPMFPEIMFFLKICSGFPHQPAPL